MQTKACQRIRRLPDGHAACFERDALRRRIACGKVRFDFAHEVFGFGRFHSFVLLSCEAADVEAFSLPPKQS
jgi:hypothetical protein